MTPHLLLDGMVSDTGLRDAITGGYHDPASVGVSAAVAAAIAAWQRRYEAAHFADFPEHVVIRLDEEGLALCAMVRDELPDRHIGYFSHGRMRRLG